MDVIFMCHALTLSIRVRLSRELSPAVLQICSVQQLELAADGKAESSCFALALIVSYMC